jgi:polyhydroxyalkanoate synthesis repressor PhaR
MIRLIKRYGSRKLYDTEESRYVLLEDIAGWIRQGQDVRVIENKTGEDVTAQTLTQIISEEGRKGRTLLPNAALHEIIRMGQEAVTGGMERIQQRVDRVVRASIDRLGPVRKAREEMEVLRQRLHDLEASLIELERQRESAEAEPVQRRTPRRAAAAKRPASARPSTPRTPRGGRRSSGAATGKAAEE